MGNKNSQENKIIVADNKETQSTTYEKVQAFCLDLQNNTRSMGLFDEKKYELSSDLVEDIQFNENSEINLLCAQILSYIKKEDRYPIIAEPLIARGITSIEHFTDHEKWNKVFDEFRFTNFSDKKLKNERSTDSKTTYMYSRITENIGLAVHAPKIFALCDIGGLKRSIPRKLFLERAYEVMKEWEEWRILLKGYQDQRKTIEESNEKESNNNFVF